MSKIHKFPVIGNFIKRLDSDVAHYGWQEGARKLIERTNTKLIIHNLDKAKCEVLEKEPVILIGNHPFEAETIVLIASLPERSDAYLIVNVWFYGLSKTIDKC